MATAATSLLGLALPVTGELSGTWGDTVNVSITALLDTAVAGTTTLSSDADVTLTTTTLAANQARQAIILWTAGGTATRTITVPAQSKSYIVINKTSSSQSIKIVGVGPTTGVTIVAGTAAFVVWNGVDFVTASVTSTTGILPVANGGTGVTTSTGTGSVVLNTSPTLVTPALGTPSSGTVTNLTGTASININGTVGATTPGTGAFTTLSATGTLSGGTSGTAYSFSGSAPATSLTLDSSGNLGIGTTTPDIFSRGYGRIVGINDSGSSGAALEINSASSYPAVELGRGGVRKAFFAAQSTATEFGNLEAVPLIFYTNSTERARIDSSGNLGLGVTPSNWGGGFKAIQNQGTTILSGGTLDGYMAQNYFNDGANKYIATGFATSYGQSTGQHIWYNAPSGAANASVTFTQAMTLAASGNLGIGTTAPGQTLHLKSETSANVQFEDTTSGTAGYVGPSANNQSDTTATRLGIRGEAGVAFSVGSATKMVLDSSGNLGIGTTSPGAKLDIAVASAAVDGTKGVRITNPAGTVVVLECGSVSDSYVGSTSSDFNIRAGNQECARFTTGGQTFINATTDAAGSGARLHITGAASQSACSIKIGTDSYPGWYFVNAAGTNVGTISINTASTAYNTSSDYRLKNTIASMTGALAKVAQLKPVTYKWNINGSDGEGFIAHELAEVCPHAVSGEKDAVETQQYEISPAVPATFDEDGTILTPAVEAVMGEREVPKYQGIDTSFLVATLTAAIQEQQALITQLTARVTALETA